MEPKVSTHCKRGGSFVAGGGKEESNGTQVDHQVQAPTKQEGPTEIGGT